MTQRLTIIALVTLGLCTPVLVRAAPYHPAVGAGTALTAATDAAAAAAAPGTASAAGAAGAVASAGSGRVRRSVETEGGRDSANSCNCAYHHRSEEGFELQLQASSSDPLTLAGYVQVLDVAIGRHPWMSGVIAAELLILGFGLWWMCFGDSWLRRIAGIIAAAYGIFTVTICVGFVAHSINRSEARYADRASDDHRDALLPATPLASHPHSPIASMP